MILVASQRGGARQLAAHLLNDRENDHVTVAETRGFIACDLRGALDEAHAVSTGTRCKQFLFSLSLNPPKSANASLDDLMAAIDAAELRIGLKGQPRAVVIHEKHGRRHAHVVWSRIDSVAMKAVNLPHFKRRLAALSKDLYLEHGWDLPEGHRTNGWKNPLNFTLAEWQQAKRIGLDPREIKLVFQAAWERSDNQASFRRALEEHGYWLARGDRRGFVALDLNGEVFAVSRLINGRTKDVKAKLGDPSRLPSVEQARAGLERESAASARKLLRDQRRAQALELAPLHARRQEMVETQRRERADLTAAQSERQRAEALARAARFRSGLSGVWDALTGKTAARRRENERDALLCWRRDMQQREWLFQAQNADRSALQREFDALQSGHRSDRMRALTSMIGLLKLAQTDTRLGALRDAYARIAVPQAGASEAFLRAARRPREPAGIRSPAQRGAQPPPPRHALKLSSDKESAPMSGDDRDRPKPLLTPRIVLGLERAARQRGNTHHDPKPELAARRNVLARGIGAPGPAMSAGMANAGPGTQWRHRDPGPQKPGPAAPGPAPAPVVPKGPEGGQRQFRRFDEPGRGPDRAPAAGKDVSKTFTWFDVDDPSRGPSV